MLNAPSYFYINTLKLFIFLFFLFCTKERAGRGVPLSMPGLFVFKKKRGRALLEPQELSFCTVIGSLSQDSNRAERLMDSSEAWELDLLDCEDVIYSCNLFGDISGRASLAGGQCWGRAPSVCAACLGLGVVCVGLSLLPTSAAWLLS